MAHFLKVYVILIPICFIIDFLWLGVLMGGFYQSQLGTMVRRVGGSFAPDKWAALAVYILIPLGIMLFALPHVNRDHLPYSALMWGFVYGVVLYGVYDMTNLAMLVRWPLKMALVDIAWGGMICAIVTLIAAWLDGQIG